jgi:hypothetical protein
MSNVTLQTEAELKRLKSPPPVDESIGGIGGVRFIAHCPNGADDVLAKVVSILSIVDETVLLSASWPSDEEWASILPEWFASACAAPMTLQQTEQWLAWWRGLPRDKQAKVENERKWSLDSWIYWFQPENRYWYWWDAKILDDRAHIIAVVQVEDWPFPWGALRWLFRAAGASSLEAEE